MLKMSSPTKSRPARKQTEIEKRFLAAWADDLLRTAHHLRDLHPKNPMETRLAVAMKYAVMDCGRLFRVMRTLHLKFTSKLAGGETRATLFASLVEINQSLAPLADPEISALVATNQAEIEQLESQIRLLRMNALAAWIEWCSQRNMHPESAEGMVYFRLLALQQAEKGVTR
jgi:hypothetical protein